MTDIELRTLNDRERLDWLQLSRTETIGPISLFRLLKKFSGASEALSALPSMARAAGRGAPLKVFDRDAAKRELDAAKEIGARLIAACEPDYPAMLRPVADRPPLLYAQGHLSLCEAPPWASSHERE